MPVSPQVVIREEEITNITPNVSTTRVALVGTAQKGTLNKPILVSTPNDYIALFGEPTPEDFLGIAALNFLNQGNQLYVVRVGSIRGDDPISYATTDLPAIYETAPVPDSFGNLDAILTLEIDNNQFSLNFNNFTGNGADALAEFINLVINNLGIYPLLAKAESFTDGVNRKVRITTLSRKGELSYIKVLSISGTQANQLGAIFTTAEVRGKRTVFTSEVLLPAVLDSSYISTISTAVQNALVKANTVNTKPVNTLYNVSKLSKEAFKILNVNTTNINAKSWRRFTVRIKKSAFLNTDPITFKTKDSNNIDVFVYNIGGSDNVDTSTKTITQNIPSLNTDDDWNNFISEIQKRYNGANTDYFSFHPFLIIERISIVNDGGDDYVEFIFRQLSPNTTYKLEISGNNISNNSKFSSADGTNPSTYQSKLLPNNYSLVTNSSSSFSVDFSGDIDYQFIVADASSANITNTQIEKVVYYILLGNDGADVDITNASSVNDIADLITIYINNKVPFVSSTITYISNTVTVNPKIFAFSASRVNNQITVTTRTPLKAEGNYLKFYSSGTFINNIDPVNNNLGHGFNDRPNYSFAKFSVDGVAISNSGINEINFDLIPSSIIPNKHEASIIDIVNAINYVARNTSYGKNVASFVIESGNEHLIIFSSSSGSEGSVTVTSSSTNVGGQNDPFLDPSSATVTGQGDNHIKFTVDDTYTFDIFLTPGNNRTPESIVDEINNFIRTNYPTLPTLVSVVTDQTGKKIRIQSVKKGNYSDFGAKVEILNNLQVNNNPLFPNTIAFGSGAKRASISIKATSQGTWANKNIKVEFVNENPQFFIPGSVMVNVYFKNQLVEQYREVVLSPTHENFIERVINGVSKYITVDFDDDIINDLDPNTIIDSVFILPGVYTLDGGNNGMHGLTDADIIGTIDQFGNRTGLTILSDVDQIKFDILAVPGVTSEAVQNKMIEIAESRQDILVILDPPLGLNTQQVIDWHNGNGYGRSSPINSSYAAVYNTWLIQFDSFNNIDRFIPPSAIILPVLAFTDRTSNPWFAPAGLIRGKVNGVKDVVYNASLGERESLMGSGNAINPIVKFVGEGIFVWGDITSVRRETPLKDIGVRRMVNFIKNTVSIIAKQILFEPNDPISAKRLLDTINPFLHSILTRRGLTEFKVVDKTTPFDRDQGRMVINVLVKPTRSTKIIEIPLTITSQGVSL